MESVKCFPYRPHDYMYDPIFTVAGPTDHYKAAVLARMSSYKFQVCPVFDNMFSELANKPRTQLVQRPQPPIQPYVPSEDLQNDPALIRRIDVRGTDRVKFFCHIINLPLENVLPIQPRFTIEKYTQRNADNGKTHKDAYVETKYRESSAQTSPWQPAHYYVQEKVPELLEIGFLKWGKGLPAGVFEVKLIERARMKRQWDKYLEDMFQRDPDVEKLRDCIEAIEREEWAIREGEIQDIQNLRYELLVDMFTEIVDKSKTRVEQKLNNLMEIKKREIDEEKAKLRKKTERELRKLNHKRLAANKKMDIIDKYTNSKSELYAPIIRNGENAKRWHFIIDNSLQKYKSQFHGVEKFNTLPAWVNKPLKVSCPKSRSKVELCIRETKWTEPVLKQLHEELINLNKISRQKPCTLLHKIEKVVAKKVVIKVPSVPDKQENLYQALVTIQSVIKGRASQMIVYEGRNRCRELIDELKNSHGLLREQKQEVFEKMRKVREEQQRILEETVKSDKVQSVLDELQGSVVGSLLDFLNKELRRLIEERKIHAICKKNERERYIREAAEAGRRQKELQRRKEHDEMFKQIVKINQESVDLYLRDIIIEGMNFVSEEEAKLYVKQLGEKLDQEIDEKYDDLKKDVQQQDSLVNDLVHHFLLPEIAKINIREDIKKQQKIQLKTIHETVFSQLEQTQEQKKISKPYHTTNSIIESSKEENLLLQLSEQLIETIEPEGDNISVEEFILNEIVTKLCDFPDKNNETELNQK